MFGYVLLRATAFAMAIGAGEPNQFLPPERAIAAVVPKLRLLAPVDVYLFLPATAQHKGLTRAWLMAQPTPKGDAHWQCLAQAIYFEARGESLDG